MDDERFHQQPFKKHVPFPRFSFEVSHDLVRVVFSACQKRDNDSDRVMNQEIERWARLEFPDMTLPFLKCGSLNAEQEEDLDLELGLC